MKKLLLIFICFISVKSFAQDPQLDDNTWYLYNVIVNGEDHIPPVNVEVTDITLDFFDGQDFHSVVCNDFFGTLNFDDAESTFTFIGIGITLINCNLTENNVYESSYFNFYGSNQSDPFTYEITNDSGMSTLIITASNGDQAIYGSVRLNVMEFKSSKIKTYPNPMINKLTVEKINTIKDLKVNVYNLQGRLMFSEMLEGDQNSIINVESLDKGIYFFVFEGDGFKSKTTKIIKQ
ncbi:hypothetical protein C1T31_07455 [Hanstruepera neustonica]|uniref:Secretion system C-terminal sorting domain-containing protein n=1 Tax=Hanstruepera neustonica TaxID=1445657 RepID=A0A2K1DZ89_9FLAO|nr:T9SS type A sorting domain-containing protein [Hanstruepera neustonica]PNQ73346.1 hypothetical protein C1T31_07455 [Hanstruepera neustonica]